MSNFSRLQMNSSLALGGYVRDPGNEVAVKPVLSGHPWDTRILCNNN